MRRSLQALVLLTLATAGQGAEVAVVKSVDVPSWKLAIDAMRRGLPTLTVTEYDLKGDRTEGEKVIGGLKGKGAIVVAMGNLAAQMMKDLAPDMPMVFCMIQDPAKLNLLGAPNITGVAFTVPIKNQLAAFRMVYPRGVRIGVIYSAENVGKQVQEALKAAAVVRLNIVDKPVTSEREVPEAVRSLLKGNDSVDALWIPPDPVLIGDETRKFLLGESLKAAKPVFTFSSSLVQEGALVSDGPDYGSIGEQVAEIVTRIGGGEKPAKIEMLIPRAELVINKKIAEKLKIEIPADALRTANKVY